MNDERDTTRALLVRVAGAWMLDTSKAAARTQTPP
jgi:hypothetical protein